MDERILNARIVPRREDEQQPAFVISQGKETNHLSEVLNEPVLTQLEVEIFHPQIERRISSMQVLSSELQMPFLTELATH